MSNNLYEYRHKTSSTWVIACKSCPLSLLYFLKRQVRNNKSVSNQSTRTRRNLWQPGLISASPGTRILKWTPNVGYTAFRKNFGTARPGSSAPPPAAMLGSSKVRLPGKCRRTYTEAKAETTGLLSVRPMKGRRALALPSNACMNKSGRDRRRGIVSLPGGRTLVLA